MKLRICEGYLGSPSHQKISTQNLILQGDARFVFFHTLSKSISCYGVFNFRTNFMFLITDEVGGGAPLLLPAPSVVMRVPILTGLGDRPRRRGSRPTLCARAAAKLGRFAEISRTSNREKMNWKYRGNYQKPL